MIVRGAVQAAILTVGASAMLSLGSCTTIPKAAPPPVAQAKVQPAPAPVIPPPRPQRPAEFLLTGEAIQGGVMLGTVPGGTASLLFSGEQIPFDDEGNFMIGFNRDAPTGAVVSARLADGRTIDRSITVAPRDWDIERVNVALRSSGPSEAFERIRAPEIAQIVAARTIRSGSEGWRQKFIWPVKGRLSGRFGSQRIYQGVPGSYHSGMDIATGESGTPFVAPADGVVILASIREFSLEGNLLMIDHGMGLNSAFLHLSNIAVREGDVVRQGQYLGNIGATGRATGPHLHWGMKWNDARIDPLLLAGPMD